MGIMFTDHFLIHQKESCRVLGTYEQKEENENKQAQKTELELGNLKGPLNE